MNIVILTAILTAIVAGLTAYLNDDMNPYRYNAGIYGGSPTIQAEMLENKSSLVDLEVVEIRPRQGLLMGGNVIDPNVG